MALTVIEPAKYEGKTITAYFSLQDEARWRLRAFLEAAGMDIPDDQYSIDFDDLEGRKCIIQIIESVYNGETSHKVGKFFDVFEDDEEPAKKGRKDADEDDEDEPAPKKRGKKALEPEEDEEEDEKPAPKKKSKKGPPPITGDEVVEMDEDDLEGVIETYGLDVDLSSYKTLRKKCAAVVEALEETDQLAE